MPNEDSILDNEQVNNLKELFGEGFAEFLTTFFEDFEKKDGELSAALRNNNLEEISKIAHSLKGSSLNIGASALAKSCYDLETASKNGNIVEVTKYYNAAHDIYPATKKALQEISK